MGDFDPKELDIGGCPEPEMSEPARKAGKPKAKYPVGFLRVPAQMMARHRLYPLSPVAWAVLCCLLDLEYKAGVKGEPISLTKDAAARWKISRWQKHRGLKELTQREFLTYTWRARANPRVTLFKHLLK